MKFNYWNSANPPMAKLYLVNNHDEKKIHKGSDWK